MISKDTLRQMTEKYHTPIQKDALSLLHRISNDIIDGIIVEAVFEFEKHNEFRRMHGLPEKKKLDAVIIQRGYENVVLANVDVDVSGLNDICNDEDDVVWDVEPPKHSIEVQ